MNQWTITKRTVLGFSSIILAVMAFGGITLWELQKLNLGIHAMTGDSMPVTTDILEIDRQVQENLGLAQAHINSSDKPSLTHVSPTEKTSVTFTYTYPANQGIKEVFLTGNQQ